MPTSIPCGQGCGPAALAAATTKARDWQLSLHVERLALEDQRGGGRNDAPRAARAIAERRRDDQRALATDRHRGNALVPAGNHPLLADRKLERLAAVDR